MKKLSTRATSVTLLAVAIALVFTGCSSTAGNSQSPLSAEIVKGLQAGQPVQPSLAPQIPDAVAQQLLPNMPVNLALPADDQQRFDINAHEVDVRSFFAGLVEGTPYSVAIHPKVSGVISLNLKEVTLQDAMAVLRSMYDLDLRLTGKVIQVLPATIRTETIPVNYLMMKRVGLSSTSITAGGVAQRNQQSGSGQQNGQNGLSNSNNASNGNSNNGQLGGNSSNQNGLNGSQIYTKLESDFWQDLEKALQAMLGAGSDRFVVVSPQAGLVSVRAMPSEIQMIKDFLAQNERALQRQVILETKIIEVTLNDDFQQGINWQQAIANVRSTNFNFSTSAGSFSTPISASLGGVSNIVFSNQDFSGVVTLLQTQGNVQVLSSPRVTATNNQKAVIKVGQDEYFVTEVSSTTVTGNATTTTPEIQLTPFFSGIALDVTPQIDEQGAVTLHVHPSVTETAEQQKIVTLNDEQYVLPLAQSNIRESDTVIRARNGEIVVIGGLMQTTIVDKDSKTPLLGDIPLVGNLFKSSSKKEVKKELVILLKPIVVGEQTWQNELQNTSNNMQSWYQR